MTTNKQQNISLKEYFDAKLVALEKATILAASQLEKRLEGMNEFRAQLKAQNAEFLTRIEYAAHLDKSGEAFKTLNESKEQHATKLESILRETDVSAAALNKRLEGMNEFRMQLKDQVQTFFTRPEHELFMRKVDDDIRILRESKAAMDAKASQSSFIITLIVAIVGIFISLFTLVHEYTSASKTPAPIVYYQPAPAKVVP